MLLRTALAIASVLVIMISVLVKGITEEDRLSHLEASQNGRAITTGALIFENNCVRCHGPQGQGGIGPALNNKYFFERRMKDLGYPGSLANYIRSTIMSGRPAHSNYTDKMPAWSDQVGGPLRDDQINDLVAFVLNFQGKAGTLTADDGSLTLPAEGSCAEGQPNCGTARGATTGIGQPGKPADVSPSEQAEAAAKNQPVPTPPPAGGGQPPAAGGDYKAIAQRIFTQGKGAAPACMSCHNIEREAVLVGPPLVHIGTAGATRKPGMSAADYIRESITDPNAFIAPAPPGYPPFQPNVMYQFFKRDLAPEEIDALVKWLSEDHK